MDGGKAQRIEAIAAFAAAAVFAAAAAFAVSRFAASTVMVGAAAAVALFVALQVLRSIGPEDRQFSLAQFAPSELVLEDPNELFLTDADRLDQDELLLTETDRLNHGVVAKDELLLDDVLASLEEDSRVVRMFDPSAAPTPGQLGARIDRHPGQARPVTAVPDASAALHEALAELRLSLK